MIDGLLITRGGGGGSLLLEDPVGEGGDFLTPLLLGRVGFGGREVDLLLDTLGGERALVLEAARGDVLVAGALRAEADMDAMDIVGSVPLACDEVFLRDTVLGGLDLGGEDAETVDLDGVALREELYDTARHLGEDTLDDVTAIDGVVFGHVVAETAQGDGLLLLGLGVVLAVAGVVLVVVLSEVDSELGIFYSHFENSFSRLTPL